VTSPFWKKTFLVRRTQKVLTPFISYSDPVWRGTKKFLLRSTDPTGIRGSYLFEVAHTLPQREFPYLENPIKKRK
jgi:hypothetical protein